MQPQRKYDSELVQSLLEGDILLYRSLNEELVGSAISEFTRSPYSHAEIYVGDGWSVSASSIGLKFVDTLNTGFIDVLRVPGGLTAEQKAVILERCRDTLGYPYEYLLLVGFPFWGSRAAAARAENQSYICSEHVAWAYQEAGIELVTGRARSMIAPADLAHATNLLWLGSWRNGTRVADAVPNVRHRLQGPPNWLAKLAIRALADPFSLKDEYYTALQLGLSPLPADFPARLGRSPVSLAVTLLVVLLGAAGLMRLPTSRRWSLLQRLARLNEWSPSFSSLSWSPAPVGGRCGMDRDMRLARAYRFEPWVPAWVEPGTSRRAPERSAWRDHGSGQGKWP